jgi:competence protein ComEC
MLWSPAALMLGIAAYFRLENEPPLYIGIIALALGALLLAIVWKQAWRVFAWPLFLVVLGFSAAQFRAHWVMTPLLSSELNYVTIEGIVDEIEPVEKRVKVVLSHPFVEHLPVEQTPKRLRISFREHDLEGIDLRIGSHIMMDGTLFPLPQPVMPGSYDFSRHFYFRSIGGNGFAIHPPQVIGNTQSGVSQWLGNLRHDIGNDMRDHMPGATGTVAAAMTVGETGPIPEDIKNTLRDAGLAHMLAIAGLHLGIVAGIIFFNVRLVLTFWPALALRISAKKIAAVLALASAAVYLTLAGGPIPAERAFIGVTFLFAAILLERRGVTLRTLALAACFILLVFPEAMFGASFQLSFAATLAIVSFYERFGHGFFRMERAWWNSIVHEVVGIAFTSLVATLATAPFILYNFNRFAAFGIIANMIVVPLATFVIMPGIVLAVLLMPLGLQAVGYVLLKFGVDVMIRMAGWVTSLPYASIRLPSPSDVGLTACALGLMWLCLMTGRWRLFGLPVIAAGLATMAFHVPPDVLISNDMHQVMVHTQDGQYTMLKGSGRAFVAQSWLRAEGQDEVVPVKETGIACDKVSCDYTHEGYRLLVLKKPSDDDALKALCAQKADVMIAYDYLTRANCPLPAMLIGRGEVEQGGAYELWLAPEGIKVVRAQEKRDNRLWHVY